MDPMRINSFRPVSLRTDLFLGGRQAVCRDGQEDRFGVRQARVCIPSSRLPGCVTLGKLPDLSETQFPPHEREIMTVTGLLWGQNKIPHVMNMFEQPDL